MRRITVDEVKAAYEKTGLKPCTGRFGDGYSCGCPIMAIVKSESGIVPAFLRYEANDMFGAGYTCGFMRGVDGMSNQSIWCDMRKYADGYADGLAVRQAIFGDAT